jgi:5,10-methenyltetrahydrofolate synthetase
MASAPGFPPGKTQLRQVMVARRDGLAAAEVARLAAALTARVTALPEYAAARAVLCTMAIGSEWSTRAFIELGRAHGKTIVLPRVTAPPRHLELHAVRDFERDLKPGVWEIPEPDPQRCPVVGFAAVDFALVPALAVDRDGYRLGYGAGYFDRLLTGRGARPFCVTALPALFHVGALPHEPHDVPVDLAVDENGPVTPGKKRNP